MSIEYRNFTSRLSSLGKKIIITDPKGDNFWDDLLPLVADLEVTCKKFRAVIDKKRDKDEA